MKRKTIIVSFLCLLIPLMAIGYAILNQTLVINGTSHIDSNWQVEIIGITESDVVGDATDKVAPSYTATTANFRVSLINPTDSITYNIRIKNLGNLDARIKKINVDTGNSDAIEYEVKCKIDNGEYQVCDEAHFKNQVLEPNKEQMVKIKVSFKEGYIGDPSSENKTSTVKVVIDYVQNFEENGTQILPPEDKSYSIGDVVEFAGSNWYVIEDSPDTQDYVVLLKEKVLTGTEIGANYVRGGNTSNNEMAYYWSLTCHSALTYGADTYNDDDYSGCSGHNDYAGSKVREMLESTYLPTMDENNLKEIGGYKIRLIENEDVNFDYNWINHDFGGSYYWTMTTYQNYSLFAWFVSTDTRLHNNHILSAYSVRPVINLYKSAIGS